MDILKRLVLPIVPQKYIVKFLLERFGKNLFDPPLKLDSRAFEKNNTITLHSLRLNSQVRK